ncbi:nitrate/nitrite transporter [Chengkuizengella sediminis]|uniref:nitrate/nitrite transporter n=1 Tax=Chengkuizengella sediminis TaxID=1885917 RepID=UPI00138A1793|nr:nitrate/nitrite transporter [Chengkuizengella sediminis]NDI33478.1 NarK/NasA family nitrate transporter [Chengkuizengella sediminis]
MRLKEFLRSGHNPTLFASFLYFDISFMIWVLLGPTGTFIVEDLGLSDFEKGMMVGIPVLGGALLRIPMGLMADRFGGKRIGQIGMILTMIPLTWGWLFANNLPQIYMLGFLLGVAGASFAVALPLASRWYPKKHQGLAMGIAGAGNSGTVIATLFGPRLAEMYSWQAVFGIALLPLLIAFVVFTILAKDNPKAVKPMKVSEYMQVIKHKHTWLYSFFYSLSFGGFVGLTGYLTLFFYDQYGVSKVTAGDFVTLCVFAGSFIRPIGGYFADRYGGLRLLVFLFSGAMITLLIVGMLPSVYVALAMLFLTLLFLGAANGALFQVIPVQFPKEVGLLTGFVGAAGGLGGFFLPNILGTFKELTGTYTYGFWWVSGTILVAIVILVVMQKTSRVRNAQVMVNKV